MADNQTLSIAGYRGEPVPNTFTRQAGETDTLALVLPGLGYTADMPLLFYARLAARETGADILSLETNYSRRPAYSSSSDKEQLAWIDADADAALAAALAQRPYQRLILIGKSLGTMAMGHLLERHPSLPESSWVWLTPVLSDQRQVEQIQSYRPRSLFAIGTADHYYNEAILKALVSATQGRLVTVPGANHSLEIPGSITDSIRALEQVTTELVEFLPR